MYQKPAPNGGFPSLFQFPDQGNNGAIHFMYRRCRMPFPKQARHEFIPSRVSAVRPNQPGVYGIFNHSCCIYIAKAEDIREGLLQHFQRQSDLSACIFEHEPVYWQATIVDRSLLSFWENILRVECRPVCTSQPFNKRQA